MERAGISDPGDRAGDNDAGYGPSQASSAGWRGLSGFQWLVLASTLAAASAVAWSRPDAVAPLVVTGAAAAFLTVSLWRVLLVALSASPTGAPDGAAADLPPYTVLVALHRRGRGDGSTGRAAGAYRLPGRTSARAADP